ncbi:ATP-binding protein [Sphingomonas sp.]|uniref:sensor histidine kinase n=1 Tax=Sphingomonas sp. TaxID=28214 RepID=UPI00286CEDC0|nr:ATP-binding protein [Sphingomonas sp.]
MALDTDSERSEPVEPRLRFRGPNTLATRLLATNLLTLGLMTFGILALDQFRDQLLEERIARSESVASFAANTIDDETAASQRQTLERLGRVTESRLRLYRPDGALAIDSWKTTGPTFTLVDPRSQPWTKDAARLLDRGFNALTDNGYMKPFTEPKEDRRDSWPEAGDALTSRKVSSVVREAPDLTPVISAAAALPDGSVVVAQVNDRNYTRLIRSERAALAVAMLVAGLFSVALSLWLARTIVKPLRQIARAAHRVRLGRAREVRVPRLPARRDEIGMLARAVSDMSQSLRLRIDNIEAFAADVTHELKNPLASLRSAVDSLERIDDPALRAQLTDVVRQDVLRLDRLIGDISEAARTDAELARARFRKVDVGKMIEELTYAWEARRTSGAVRIAFARPRQASAIVLGDPARLARAIDNIVDNAISFSPPGGLVEIAAARVGDDIRIRIDDEGPGVPPAQREAIFNRFHSVRPEADLFGRHSGLGLAIARAIVEGHDGEIDVADRDDAPSGARFTIRLPATGEA